MNWLSAWYGQEGERNFSLLLQDYLFGKTQVLFCVVTENENNAKREKNTLAKALLRIFRSIPFDKRPWEKEGFWDEMAEAFRGAVERDGRSAAGILLIGSYFLLFQKGSPRIFVLNRNMATACLEALPTHLDFSSVRGEAESGVGILLATSGFAGGCPEEILRDGLFVEELVTKEQVERRLRALAEQALTRDNKGKGACLLYGR